MFEWLTKVKLYETTDVEKKVKLANLLADEQIEYSLDIEDLHHRNAFDAMDIGPMIAKPKDVYVFWVKRKDRDKANLVLKKM